MRIFKRIILSLAILTCFNSAFAQKIPEKVMEPIRDAMFLSELGDYDSAIAILNNASASMDKWDTLNTNYIAPFKIEIAYRHYDYKTVAETQSPLMSRPPKWIKQELPEAYNKLALAFKACGELDSALHYMKLAVETEPDLPYLTGNLANVYMARDEYHQAYALLDSLQDTSEQFNNSVLLRRAECLYYMDSVESSKTLLHKVVVREKYNTDPHVNFLLGEVYYRLGEKAQACAFYKDARRPDGFVMKTHPNNGNYPIERELKRSLIIENKIRLSCK